MSSSSPQVPLQLSRKVGSSMVHVRSTSYRLMATFVLAFGPGLVSAQSLDSNQTLDSDNELECVDENALAYAIMLARQGGVSFPQMQAAYNSYPQQEAFVVLAHREPIQPTEEMRRAATEAFALRMQQHCERALQNKR